MKNETQVLTSPENSNDLEVSEFLYSIWNFYATNLSNRTSHNYYNVVKGYIKLIGRTPLKLTNEDAHRYNQHLIDRIKEGKLSYSTAVMRISVMRSLCEYIRQHQNRLNRGYINYFNDIILPDVDKTLNKDILPTTGELNALLQLARERQDEASYLIFSLVIKCGLTSSEICSLNYDYLIFDSKDNLCINFPAKKRISRIIRIPEDVATLLLEYIDSTGRISGNIFLNKRNTPLKVRDAERLLKKYIEEGHKSNIISHSFTLQQMRHTALTYMLQGGATEENVAKYCGITTKWMSRYKKVVDDSYVISGADLSVISIKPFTSKS